MVIRQHISQQYNQELAAIHNSVISMGELVENQVRNALEALMRSDMELAESVSISDYQVNKMEVEIDEACAEVIARRQPTAGDLRMLIAVIKVITDLERIGDHAEKIGRYSKKLVANEQEMEMHHDLENLGKAVVTMLHDTLHAFAKMDEEQAAKIADTDIKINDEFNRVSRLLITHMMEDPRAIKYMLHVIWCARALERIGDHAQNICEYVIYLAKGKDVRHTSLERILKERESGAK